MANETSAVMSTRFKERLSDVRDEPIAMQLTRVQPLSNHVDFGYKNAASSETTFLCITETFHGSHKILIWKDTNANSMNETHRRQIRILPRTVPISQSALRRALVPSKSHLDGCQDNLK